MIFGGEVTCWPAGSPIAVRHCPLCVTDISVARGLKEERIPPASDALSLPYRLELLRRLHQILKGPNEIRSGTPQFLDVDRGERAKVLFSDIGQ